MTGVSRVAYDPAIRIVRLRCTGRVDSSLLLEPICKGADGVMVVGCHVGECDFDTGNIMAERHVNFVKRILERRGLGGDRVNMYHCSAAEVGRFKESIDDMMRKLEKLGPNPLRGEK